MKVTKPDWVIHTDDKKKRTAVFSLHIHPDCSRLATGGLDTKIRIWSTLPILSPTASLNPSNHRLLCTLDIHNGPVLVVRWAHHGRYLASGSDDGMAVVWDLDPNGGGKVWGSDDVNVEAWKPMRRLPGHESDVVDLSWNTDDSMMASVGLDSMIFIWDGFTFERLRKIDGHQGFVKGVCWDPVGKYLATQSDDKTVKIWRTSDWALEASVEEPFKQSPGSTFFRRLSWSPDGAFIAASNAMNGPVFVAAVIDRTDWSTDISFVGHENTIQCAAFNPRLLTGQTCMLALGADDNSISIWRNDRKAPLIVLKDIFDRQCLDLCWSNDGRSIYGCSSDGTICAIHFEPEEVPDLQPSSFTIGILKNQGYEPRTAQQAQAQSLVPSIAGSTPIPAPNPNFVNILAAKPVAQKITIMANGKRRIQPSVITTGTSAAAPIYVDRTAAAARTAEQAFATAAEEPLENESQAANARNALLQDVDNVFDVEMTDPGRSSFAANVEDRNGKSSQRTQAKSRTLGGDRPRESGPVREFRPAMTLPSGGLGQAGPSRRLPVPVVQTELRIKAEDDESIVFEGTNDVDGGPSTVTFLQKGIVQWLDFNGSAVVGLACSSHVAAAAFEDGRVVCYSANGIRRMPVIKLDSTPSFVHACKYHVLVVTASGKMHAWNTLTRQAAFPPVSVLDLLDSAPGGSTTPPPSISTAIIRPNGTPLIQLTNGTSYAYDAELQSWLEISSSWWAESSPLWTKTRSTVSSLSSTSTRTLISILETSLNELNPSLAAQTEAAAGKTRPRWWTDALTLGHLETRMYACALLDSPVEYRTNLVLYAKKIGEEGYKGKAEELVRELWGPIHFNATNDQQWKPTVCGLQKRDLVRDVLGVFAKAINAGISDVAKTWQERMRASAMEM